jgi:hypothetical protein
LNFTQAPTNFVGSRPQIRHKLFKKLKNTRIWCGIIYVTLLQEKLQGMYSQGRFGCYSLKNHSFGTSNTKNM